MRWRSSGTRASGAGRRIVRPNETEWKWTARSESVALEVARDLLPDEAIARECRISKATLERWKQHPDFQARVIAHRALWREQIADLGLRDRENRIRSENERWRKLQDVIEARANDPEMQKVPGGKTGLLVKRTKSVGFGETAEIVEEYAVDTGLLKEIRDLEQQAAKDLGQWVERREVRSDDKSFARDYALKLPGVTPEEAERIAAMVTQKG
jgi:hypothetical protein